MARFTSINCSLPVRQDRCDLASVEWSSGKLTAVFWTKEFLVKVTFEEVLSYRVMDEMIYSIYGERVDGVTREGFGYTVHDSAIFPNLNDLSRHGWRNLRHYAFMSLNNFLDVLCNKEPSFEIIAHANPR